jgi:hypothetical protein
MDHADKTITRPVPQHHQDAHHRAVFLRVVFSHPRGALTILMVCIIARHLA